MSVMHGVDRVVPDDSSKVIGVPPGHRLGVLIWKAVDYKAPGERDEGPEIDLGLFKQYDSDSSDDSS
jgi:hypothetical protein